MERAGKIVDVFGVPIHIFWYATLNHTIIKTTADDFTAHSGSVYS